MTCPSAIEARLRSHTAALACGLLLVAGSIQGLSAALLLAGAPLHEALVPVSIVCALAGLWRARRAWGHPAPVHLWTLTAALVLTVVVLTVITAGALYDVSFDGQTYQQEGALQLARGWNPVWDAPAAVRQLWPVDNYPKGPWLLAASLYLLTGSIESAKAFTLVFMVTAWSATCAACLCLRPGRGLLVPFAVASLVALNPVAVTQWTGFFVDGQMACLLATAVACMVLVWVHGGRAPLFMLGVTTLLLVTTKFTGLVYAGTLVAMFVAVVAWSRGPRAARRVATSTCLHLALGALVVSANPYVTNTLRHGHPLYPLAGPGAIDVMEAQRPGGFEAADRLTRLLTSTFARSASVLAPVEPLAKWPFSVHADEFRSFAVAEVRAAGFGPLFAAALVLSGVVWLSLWRGDVAVARWTTIVAAGLLASVVINPEAWWARFAPQLWLVPVIVGFAGAQASRRTPRWLSGALCGVLLANAGGIALVHTQAAVGRTRVVRAQLDDLVAMPQPLHVHFGAFYSNRIRLLEHGIRYVDMDQLRCAHVDALAYSQTRVCVTR